MKQVFEMIEAEVEELKADGFDRMDTKYNQLVRAAKVHLDCAGVIEKYGSLPEGHLHAGWPWPLDVWNPDRFNAQKHVLRAAAFLILETERSMAVRAAQLDERIANATA